MIDFEFNYLIPILFGFILVAAGIWKFLHNHKIKNTGIKTSANIINYKHEKNNYDSDNKNYYFPIVEFVDSRGESRTVIYDIGTTIKPNTVLPKKIEIFYIEKNGIINLVISNHRITDFFTIGLLLLGCIILISTGFIYFYKN